MRILVLTIFSLFSFCSHAQNQFALLIGINQYAPPPGNSPSSTDGRTDFPNLEGCRNDVNSMYSIITSRFAFDPKNIDTLFDNNATRESILHGMNELLLKCHAGDIACIYYAGHGSQVRNSLSANKKDLRDESIVPSDTWKPGVRDIRDKELSRIFNAFLDKNIKLTVIFDCCHSGSISRGPNLLPGKLRFMPESNWDAKDPSQSQVPEKRAGNNFLIFSSCQANDKATELSIREDSGIIIHHGAFTHALAEALQQESANISALGLFLASRGILKNYGLSQEPVIGGSAERQSESLFGLAKGKLLDHSTVAVEYVKDGKVVIQGGWALGIYKGNELARISDNDLMDTLFKLKVEMVEGVNRAFASVLKGEIKDIKPGNLFRVTNWASPDIPLINIYIPNNPYSELDIKKITGIAAEVKRSPKIVWLESIRDADPYTTIFFEKGKAFIRTDKATPEELKNINAQSILGLCKKDSTLYFEIPASGDSANNFAKKLKLNHNVNIVDDMAQANYCLFGKLGRNNAPAYGFRKSQTSASDSLESMPVVTDCFEIRQYDSRSVADSLAELVKKLSKIRAWLSIIKTPDGSHRSFPFHMEIMNEEKKQLVKDRYRIGDSISFSIVSDSDYFSFEASLKPKFAYVFALDQSGRMSLYFPDSAEGNSLNMFPKYIDNKLISHYPINLSSRIGLPTGTDNYFLLASETAIPNPYQVFNQESVNTGVIARGGGTGEFSPLAQMLDTGNVGTSTDADKNYKQRSPPGKPPSKLPSTWSLQKLAVKCTY